MTNRLLATACGVVIFLVGALSACSSPAPAAPATTAVAPPVTTAPEPSTSTSTTQPPPAPATTTHAPATTTAPPSPTNTFGIGTAYSGRCSVAWPSAPVTTSNTIQMTMSCTHIPGQYMVVLVVYGDPTLQVTPSTGSMTVTGTVEDFATTTDGLTVPVIIADKITIP